MLALAFVRSPHAHARVRAVDPAAARALASVAGVVTGADLRGLARPLAPRLAGEGFTPSEWPALADAEVCYVGQAVAVVAAETAYVAADAGELVRVEYEARPAVATVTGNWNSNRYPFPAICWNGLIRIFRLGFGLRSLRIWSCWGRWRI